MDYRECGWGRWGRGEYIVGALVAIQKAPLHRRCRRGLQAQFTMRQEEDAFHGTHGQ